MAASHQFSNIRMLQKAKMFAATLPEDRRPTLASDAATAKNVAAYALEVYNVAKAYNHERAAGKAKQGGTDTGTASTQLAEKAAVTVSTLATPQQAGREVAREETAVMAQNNTSAKESTQAPQLSPQAKEYGRVLFAQLQ